MAATTHSDNSNSNDLHSKIFQQLSPSVPTKLFIANQWVDAEDKSTFQVLDPTTEGILCEVAHAKKVDVDKAVTAAREAFNGEWGKMDPVKRAFHLMKLADLIEQHKETLAKLESLNNGKAYLAALGYDIQQTINVFRYYAGWCDKLPLGEIIPTNPAENLDIQLSRQPLGVVGCILPWNFPLMLLTWKVAPALCCGCTVVVKPAEQTPLTALFLGLLVEAAGFPKGVVNIVPGFGHTTGEALTRHNDVDKVSFTGSTEVGRLIMKASAESNLKKVQLELGGKSPNIIFDDIDNISDAVGGAVQALFLNMGQNCVAGSRLYVQSSLYDKFMPLLLERVSQIVVGDPLDGSSSKAALEGKIVHGPLVNKEQFTKVMSYISSGKEQGAKLLTGGDRLFTKGYFIQPTVFGDVHDTMSIAQEEIFGPVLSVLKFDTLDEAIEKANNTIYGLGAAVWTSDRRKIKEFTTRVKAGIIWANTYNIIKYNAPFGGMKSSGFGRDLGKDALFEYMAVKTVVSKI